jgi:hypothetical protein
MATNAFATNDPFVRASGLRAVSHPRPRLPGGILLTRGHLRGAAFDQGSDRSSVRDLVIAVGPKPQDVVHRQPNHDMWVGWYRIPDVQ